MIALRGDAVVDKFGRMEALPPVALEATRALGLLLRSLVIKVEELLVTFADEADDEGGPTGLVGGSEALAGLGVEVFVEEEVLIPKWIAAMRVMNSDEVP